MANVNASHVGKVMIVPVLMLVLLGVSYQISPWLSLPLIIATPIILEQICKRISRVSQRALLFRDVLSSIVNLYVTRIAAAVFFLVYCAERLLGRKMIVASSDQLGPLWLQVVTAVIVISFFRYWIHRFQHTIPFLWKFHSYHHRTTDLQTSNKYVSHPIDYAIRNVAIVSVMTIVGFDSLVFFIAPPIVIIAGAFDHCGADVDTGPLSYLIVTPEVHRWHHSANVPDGYGYSCNYGVEFSFWDIVFRTYYLPRKNGAAEQPAQIGYPGGGLPDESSYLRSLLAPLGLYDAIVGLTDGVKTKLSAVLAGRGRR
jgi:sterol desaturase/sphingolipid hydroxylase (fatty acid hydroxylase superfamily)